METTKLVVIRESIFDAGKLDLALKQLREMAEVFIEDETDLTTDKGRKLIATNARKFASSKNAIDAIGKDLVSAKKAECKGIDALRKRSRDFCDNLRDSVRAPLTAWEEREAAEKERLLALQKLINDWNDALEFNNLFNREREVKRKEAIQFKKEQEEKEEKEKSELQRIRKDREERIAKEAAQEAKDGEERAKREKAQAIKDAEERRIKDVKEAEDKAKREAQEKEDKRLSEEKRIKDEEEARAKNKSHRAAINNSILDTFTSHGVKKEAGKKIIELIATGKVQHLKITY